MGDKLDMTSTDIIIFLFITAKSVAGQLSLPIPSLSHNDNFTRFGKTYPHSLDSFNAVLPFPCKKYSVPNRNITVHSLTPMDVGVVGAIGDSITAGFGVSARRLQDMRDDRGMAFSIGGDGSIKDMISLPNIFRFYNPDLKGYSVGYGFQTESNAHLNLAITSATSITAPIQAKELIYRMKNGNESIDFENDWKVISVFIGANDLCAVCLKPEEYNTETYLSNMREALDILHQELPKTLVNLIQLGDLMEYKELDSYMNKCNLMHQMLCPCMHSANTKRQRDYMKKSLTKYQEILQKLVNTGRYDTRDDFTVVLQPFLQNARFRRTADDRIDLNYFAVDCFHLSKEGQEMGAISLWINMIQPIGGKGSGMPSEIICPSSSEPYFPTRKNGNLFDKTTTLNPYPKSTASDDEHSGAAVQIHSMVITVVGVGVFVMLLTVSIRTALRRKEDSEPESKSLLNNRP